MRLLCLIVLLVTVAVTNAKGPPCAVDHSCDVQCAQVLAKAAALTCDLTSSAATSPRCEALRNQYQVFGCVVPITTTTADPITTTTAKPITTTTADPITTTTAEPITTTTADPITTTTAEPITTTTADPITTTTADPITTTTADPITTTTAEPTTTNVDV